MGKKKKNLQTWANHIFHRQKDSAPTKGHIVDFHNHPDSKVGIVPEHVRCPFCQMNLKRTELDVSAHLQTAHKNIPPSEQLVQFRKIFGPDSELIQNTSTPPVRAKITIHRSPFITSSRTDLVVDEYGILHCKDEYPGLQSHPTSSSGANRGSFSEEEVGDQVCAICGKRVNHLYSHTKKMHDLILTEGARYECTKCRNFFSLSEATRHKCGSHQYSEPTPSHLSQQPTRVFCDQCGYYCANYLDHIAKYHPSSASPRVCPFCGKACGSRKAVLNHISNYHHVYFVSRRKNASENIPNPRLIVCVICHQRLHPHEVQKHAMNHFPPKLGQNSAPPTKTKTTGKRVKKDPNGGKLPRGHSPADVNEFSDDHLDGGRYLGWMAREYGRFGSLPEYDDYSDESDSG